MRTRVLRLQDPRALVDRNEVPETLLDYIVSRGTLEWHRPQPHPGLRRRCSAVRLDQTKRRRLSRRSRRGRSRCRELLSFSRSFQDRKSTRLNSSHLVISYAVFCLKKKKKKKNKKNKKNVIN